MNLPIDFHNIREELCEFGTDQDIVTGLSMAISEVLQETESRNAPYVVTYCPRKDRRLTVDILHYGESCPAFTTEDLQLTRKIFGELFLIKNFPKGGYTIRMVTSQPVFGNNP